MAERSSAVRPNAGATIGAPKLLGRAAGDGALNGQARSFFSRSMCLRANGLQRSGGRRETIAPIFFQRQRPIMQTHIEEDVFSRRGGCVVSRTSLPVCTLAEEERGVWQTFAYV